MEKKQELQGWNFATLDAVLRGSPRLICRGNSEGRSFEHHLPASIYPYTKHQHIVKDYCVEFLGIHRLLYRSEGRVKMDLRTKSRYKFALREDYFKFQSDLRDKNLVGLYEFKFLKSRAGDLSKTEVLSLWAPRHPDQTYTISYFANASASTEKQHCEYPLHWFEPVSPFPARANGETLRLDFARSRRRSSNAAQGSTQRRMSNLLRRPSQIDSQSVLSGTTLAATSISGTTFSGTTVSSGRRDPMRMSVSSVSSTSSAPEDVNQLPPQDLAEKHRYLQICFNSPQDYAKFTSDFPEAQRNSIRDANRQVLFPNFGSQGEDFYSELPG
jgi:hypothetical protein